MNVLIAGCGIGGLAAALAIAKTGASMQIFEKRVDPSEEGAGIQIGPNGTRILKELGVAEALSEQVASPNSLTVHEGHSGQRLANMPLGPWLAERHGSPYWVAHRVDLHKALRQQAENHPAISFELGTEVTDAKSEANGVTIFSHDDEIATGDFLIAADGVRSTIRKAKFNAPVLTYTGKSAARTVIARGSIPHGIPPDDVSIWLAPEGHVVHYPVRQGKELAIVVIRNSAEQDTGWATDIPPSWPEGAVAKFAEPVRELITASTSWRKWALYGMSPLLSWQRGRIILLGDAAHPVLPFFAQGAVLALEDACVLARELAAHSTIDDALKAYDAARRPRAELVQQASKRNGEIYHLSGAMRIARNMTLKVAPTERLMSRYDWLYSWR
ncbi:MAG: FAD-dependent monooxygenase [Filomicrobium sp.]